MFKALSSTIWADPYGTASLVRRVLVEQGSRHWLSYVISFVLTGIAAGCTAATAYLIGQVVNDTYVSQNFAAVVGVCLLTVVVFTVKGVASYAQVVLVAQVGNEIIAETQQRMFDKLMRENLAYFADRPTSGVMLQVNFGGGAMPAILNLIVNAIGRDGLTLIGLVAVMAIQEPVLSLIGFSVMPLAVLSVRKVIRSLRAMTREQYAAGANIMDTILQSLQGLRIVKAFQLEDEMRARVNASAQLTRRASNMIAWLTNRSSPVMESLGGLAIALIFLYGAFRTTQMGAAPGEFVSFMAAFLLAYEPAKRLARVNIDLTSGLYGARMLFELLDSAPTEPEEPFAPTLRVATGAITFDKVEFGYRPGEPVLRGLSLAARARSVTALVGSSGGGKSTAFNLLLRFYRPTGGSIIIDGQDIAAFSRQSVREQIGYVGQDVFLFRDSIRENIAVGKPTATMEEIVAAAEAAYAHDFIMSFPNGYETPVGEHGLQLSTGQRQRVALARALLKDAPIILLDEATSSLDSESERLIQRAVARLCEGRTTLVIAHRLHTIVHADCIHVIEGGLVVESGRHQELLRAGGRYASFYRLQLAEEAHQEERFQPIPISGP